MKTIEVNGEKYVSEADYKKVTKGIAVPTKKQIIILQRGWVVVGDYSINKEKDECTLTNAQVIRKWGTSNGLGQLAQTGKLADTILEIASDMHFHPLTVVARIDVNEANWKD